MRMLMLACLALALGCAHASNDIITPVSRVTSAQASQESRGLPCDIQDPVSDADLLFAACSAYVPKFEAAVVRSCAAAVPELASAFAGIDDTRNADDTYSDPVHVSREHRLLDAALPLLSSPCRERFPRTLVDAKDLGRPVWEIANAWRKCQPDAELAAAYTSDFGTKVVYPQAAISAGVHVFALALAPHVTVRGKQHLRKFLVCSLDEREAADRAYRGAHE